jgi:uncharacterized repeat protein (TIGR01451 family)
MVLGAAGALPLAGLHNATAVVPATPAGCNAVTSTITQSTPVAIPTGPAVVTSTIDVAGLTGNVYDLDVTTNITHTFAADMDITLASPAGTVVTLSTDNGAGNDNVFNGTVWDDDADPDGQVPYTTNDGLVTDQAYVNLVPVANLVPEEAMAAFNGEDPNGTWTLTVSDDLAGDGGSIDSWSLGITTTDARTATAAAQVGGTTLPVAIPTGPAVATATIDIAGAGTIGDVNLTTGITHTFAADLDMTLMSPAGTVVTLSTDNGAGNDNVFNGTVWDDDADPDGQVPYTTNEGIVTDHPYVNLTTATPLVPEEAMAAFNGEDPNGTWTLTVSDDLAGDGGSIDTLALAIDTVQCTTDLSTTVTDTPDPVAAGSALTYDVTVANTGTAGAAATAVSVPLPADTRFVSATPSIDGTCTTPAAGASGTVACSWTGTTAVGASRTVQIVVIPPAVGTISATATATTSTPEPDTADNAATAQTTVAPSGTVTDGGQACTILGTDGPDTLTGTAATDVICGAGGDDTITNSGPGDILDGGAGNDTLTVVSDSATAFGGLGNDTLNGNAGDDALFGGLGDDTLTGNGGADRLIGGDGRDRLRGGAGNDRLAGGTGNDLVLGQSGNDVVDGGLGNDRGDGGAGNDRVSGGAGVDNLTGGLGADRVAGDAGNDRLGGGAGNDVLVGGLGNDRLSGDAGRDRLLGGAGRDILIGGAGIDIGSGNAGIDTSIGPDIFASVEIVR